MPRTAPLLPLAILAALAARPAAAQDPSRLGQHGDWTAASFVEDGRKVCYAFTRPRRSEGAPDGRKEVLLTVTHRAAQRDAVVLTAGYPFARGAEVAVAVGGTTLSFYTVGSAAGARDGAAAVRAFRAGQEAVTEAPGPRGRGKVRDAFSLMGFTAAHEAISRECPPRGAGR